MPRPIHVIPATVLFALLLACPAAAEAQARLQLSSAEDVRLDAAVAVRFPAGAAHAWISEARSTGELRGVHGKATFQTWNVTYLQDGHVSDDRVETQEHSLQNATVSILWRGEEVRMNLLTGDGGALLASGPVAAEGSQTYLPEEVTAQGSSPVPIPSTGGRYVPFVLPAGSAYVGFHMAPPAHVGFPLEREATLGVEGEAVLQLDGGAVAFIDETGALVERQLGRVDDAGAPAGRATYRRFILEADVLSAAIPVGDRWIAGGPSAAWAIDGRVLWRNASGTLSTAEGERFFRGLDVKLQGSGRVVAPPAPLPPVMARDYVAEGAWQSVELEGISAIPSGARAPVREAAAVGAILALLLALSDWGQAITGRFIAAFYTRIAPGEILEHPKRGLIREIVAQWPGIHLRELHRRVGGAWGPFTFHLRLMQKLGALELRRDGRYATVHLPGVPPASPAPRSEIAQRILAELEREPAGMTLKQLAQRVGISPQLTRYHFNALRERGLLLQRDKVITLARSEGHAGPREADA